MVGIGGAGMSAIARILVQMGHHVSGSESAELPVIHRLSAMGIAINMAQDGSAITEDIDAVITSTAVPATNRELLAAASINIPVLHRSIAQAAMLRGHHSVAVAGSHGKTTTTAMLAWGLAAIDPTSSAFLGADIQGSSNGWYGGTGPFVMEADESDGTFRRLLPEIAIITNVEPDHLEHHESFDQLQAAFTKFVMEDVQQVAVLNWEDPVCRLIGQQLSDTAGATPSVVWVGGPSCPHWKVLPQQHRFDAATAVIQAPNEAGDLEIPMPGDHNLMNAAMGLAAAAALGIDWKVLLEPLTTFPGVARRFTRLERADGVAVIDDYAHLPTEVSVTLRTARLGTEGQTIAVFQPHRFSRTQSLAAEFADAFIAADRVVITSVYAAGEAARPGVDGHLIAEAVTASHPDSKVSYLPTREEVLEYLAAHARAGDVVVLLGAGDIGNWGHTW